MIRVLWAVVALAAGAFILWGVARVVMPRTAFPRGAEPLPTTHLQRASRWSLVLALIPAGAAAAVVAAAGPERAWAEGALRISLSVLTVGSLVAAGSAAWWVAARGAGTANGAVLDERDRAILDRAPAVQSTATILALALWTVVLIERFWSSAGVPLAFLPLVFWSCLLVNLLGLPVGVLIGYRTS